MRVDRNVAARSNQIFARCERNVYVGLGVNHQTRQSEVDHVYDVARFAQPHHNVIGFDISVDVVLPVKELDALQQLVKNHECSLQGKLLAAVVEQIFKTWAEQVCDEIDHGIVNGDTLLEKRWESFALEGLEVLNLLEQLRKGLVQRLGLDCDLVVVVVQVVCQVDFAEGTLTNFLNESVLLPDQRVFNTHLF